MLKRKRRSQAKLPKKKTSVAWKYLQGAFGTCVLPSSRSLKRCETATFGTLNQKGREMAQRMVEAANKDGITLDALKEAWGSGS